ncbi:hypothetical protein [Paenibacillus tepidiphilus]|uniref:hypothetical protein n=1 Tax=Paenibacillus tepidiphilus TaxID=2608683 RepID=UPI00123AC09B|nr:hypothetical protein [Paenibacillus tepidiphilus]
MGQEKNEAYRAIVMKHLEIIFDHLDDAIIQPFDTKPGGVVVAFNDQPEDKLLFCYDPGSQQVMSYDDDDGEWNVDFLLPWQMN